MNSKLELRLREAAKLVGGIRSLSEKSGVSERTISHWLRGTEPKVNALVAVAAAAEISVHWLATGEGQMRPGQAVLSDVVPTDAQGAIDEVLMGRVVEGISGVYKDMGARISPRDLGIAAARMASDLIEAYERPEDRVGGLPVLLQQLKRDLRSTPGEADSGKRSA